MLGSSLESSRPASEEFDRPRALVLASALLLASAVLLVINKRGILHGRARDAAEVAGMALAAFGLLYLISIWRDDRFRVSIGRLMVAVAIVAVVLQSVLAYRDWIRINPI